MRASKSSEAGKPKIGAKAAHQRAKVHRPLARSRSHNLNIKVIATNAENVDPVPQPRMNSGGPLIQKVGVAGVEKGGERCASEDRANTVDMSAFVKETKWAMVGFQDASRRKFNLDTCATVMAVRHTATAKL